MFFTSHYTGKWVFVTVFLQNLEKKHISLQLSFLFCNKLWAALDVTNRVIPSLMGIQIVHDVVIVTNKNIVPIVLCMALSFDRANKGLMMF